MANSVDPDQTAPEGAVWSGSALFAYAIMSDTLVYEILGHLSYPVYVLQTHFLTAGSICGSLTKAIYLRTTLDPPDDKTNKIACAPSEDSDQPGHPPSLTRDFAVHMRKPSVLSYPLSARKDDQTWRMPGLIWVFAGRTVILLVLSRGGSLV